MKNLNNKQNGFTLIEMAIVLVIIGLIMGAISIGKDLQRDAEYAKVKQKFADGWKQAYDGYYMRAGVVVGDDQTAPLYMIDGTLVESDQDAAEAGIPENYTGTGNKICKGQGYEPDEVGDGDAVLSEQDLHVLMDNIGIRMPPGRSEGHEDRYVYQDSNGNPAEIQICFQWNVDEEISGAGNVMVLRGLTPDLARALDQMIDGKPDAIEGRFRQQNTLGNSTTSSQLPGIEWGANNTYKEGGDAPTATDEGDNQDENRVVLLTAHWVMDQ
jgi:prepilin-type N-terminal cleavage/methylation domain-containing protein